MRQIFKVEGQNGLSKDPCVEAGICAEDANWSETLKHFTYKTV